MAKEKWLDADTIEVTEKETRTVTYSVAQLEQKVEQLQHIAATKRQFVEETEAEIDRLIGLLSDLKNHPKRPE